MITLPPNNFGLALALLAILLICLVPFVVVLWLVLFLAPWWVAVPAALAASLTSLILLVRF